MSRRAVLGGSLLVVLARPATWVLALAAFLLRGGIVLFVLPIIVLPTPSRLADAAMPTLSELVFSGPTLGIVLLAAFGIVAFLVWLLGGGWLAAAAEAEGIRLVATDDETRSLADGPAAVRGGPPGAILVARLMAHLPFAAVLGMASVRIVALTYEELTLPSSSGTPIGLRVLGAMPDTLTLLAATWILGYVVGTAAARAVVLDGAPWWQALRAGLRDVVRRPLWALVRFGLPTLALILVLAPSLVASAAGWSAVRVQLAGQAAPLPTLLALLAFIGLWAGGLVLTGMATAWGAAVWTVDAVARRGTSGSSAGTREGDYNRSEASGTL